MTHHALRRALTFTALTAALALTLTGCGVTPFAGSATEDPSSTASPTPTPTLTPIVNDLAAGSARHTLVAGDVTLEANYFSTLNMNEWTAGANKPISFSVIGSLGTDDGQNVYLSKVSVITAVTGPAGALPAPASFTDAASVAPGYLMKTPYSYSQTFVLPAVAEAATSVTFSWTYELLVQTTPTSASYAKQTATDQITVAIATPE